MKMRVRVFLAALTAIILCGCSDTVSLNKFSNIQKRLLELKSYKCTADMKVFNNKNTTSYTINQYYSFPSKLRVEVQYPIYLKGLVTVSNGKDIILSSPDADGGNPYRYENISNLSGNNTILAEFFGNYIKSEKSSMEIKGGKYRLSTEISGGNGYMDSETLTLSASGQPEKLEIFDRKGVLKLEMSYIEFQMNPKLDEKLFDVR